MGEWNGREVIHWPDAPIEGYPGWIWRDCGCCKGIEWSAGTEPIECRHCWANGVRAIHLASGTVALYPGGPLLGVHEKVTP